MYFSRASLFRFFHLSTPCFMPASSNPTGLINSGCPLGLDMMCLHLLGEALAYLVSTLLAESRHLELGSEQHSRKFQQRKQVFWGESLTGMQHSHYWCQSATAETSPWENCTSSKRSNHCIIGFSSLLSRQSKRVGSIHMVSRVFSGVWELNSGGKLFPAQSPPPLPFWVQH